MHICLRAPYLTRFSVQKIPPKGVCHNTQQEYRLIPICTLYSVCMYSAQCPGTIYCVDMLFPTASDNGMRALRQRFKSVTVV